MCRTALRPSCVAPAQQLVVGCNEIVNRTDTCRQSRKTESVPQCQRGETRRSFSLRPPSLTCISIAGQLNTFGVYLTAGKRAYYYCDLLTIVFTSENVHASSIPR